MAAPTETATRRLRQVTEVVAAVPLFLGAPLYRRWHLRWGATTEEVNSAMPGDDLVPVAHFTATRATTIGASPERVWPWIVQVGFHRAGFYSYDLLDGLGAPSAEQLLPEWQEVHVGDVAAPMTDPPTTATSFVVHALKSPEYLVWSKPDSSWSWTLTALPGGRTRLVTRLKQRYRATPSAALTVILFEFGDFPMMRRMLRGIVRRAEASIPRRATSWSRPSEELVTEPDFAPLPEPVTRYLRRAGAVDQPRVHDFRAAGTGPDRRTSARR